MHHPLLKKSFVGVVFFSLLLFCADAVVYVRTTGSDTTGTGTDVLPFLTIDKAISVLTPTNSEINLGKGTFGCPNINTNIMQSVNISGNTTRSTIIQNFQTGSCFRFYGVNITASMTQLTMDVSAGFNHAEVQSGAQLTLTNVDFTSASFYPPLVVRTGSRLILSYCNAYGLRNADRFISADATSVVTLTNSRFTNNAMWLVKGTGITLTISSCLIQKHSGVFDLSGSTASSVIFSANEVYLSTTSFTSTDTSVTPAVTTTVTTSFACAAGTSRPTGVTVSNSRFCGAMAQKIMSACSPVIDATVFSQSHDGCGRCGISTNIDKDCNGICYGPGTNCRTPITLIANITGSGDACTLNAPCNFTRAIQLAGYKDIVSLLPGDYALPTPKLFGGNAFTIKSYFNDPTTASIYGQLDQVNMGIVAALGESFDSILQNLTLGRATPSILVYNESAITLLGCVVREGQQGNNFLSGGAVILNDGFMHFNYSQFVNTSSNTAAVVYMSSDDGHTSYFLGFGSRFANNFARPNGLGTVVINTFSQASFQNCWFANNSITAGPDLTTLAPSSWFTQSGCSFFNPGTPVSLNCSSNVLHSVAQIGSSCGNAYVSLSSLCPTRVGISPNQPATCQGCGTRSGPVDCMGTCWGPALKDANGTCCYNKDRDCNGICNGGVVLDCFGVCGGTGYLSGGVCTTPPPPSTI